MFTSSGAEPGKTPGPRPSGSKEPGLSIVASGLRVEGELDTNGVIKVEGTIVGRVRAERQVLVAKGGLVDGDILTREAIIGGEVKGAIFADERVEVQANSSINGDITTQRIVVQEGGEINGTVQMGNPNALSVEKGPRSKNAQPQAQRQAMPDRHKTPAKAQAL